MSRKGCLGTFPRRNFTLAYTRDSQLLDAFWSQESQPHTVSQAGRGLKRFQAEPPGWSTAICEIPPLGLMQMLFGNLQEGRPHSCLSEQPVLKLKYSLRKTPVWTYLVLTCISHPLATIPLWRDRLCLLHLLTATQGLLFASPRLCSPSWTSPVPLGAPPRLCSIPDHPEGPSAPAATCFNTSEGLKTRGTVSAE